MKISIPIASIGWRVKFACLTAIPLWCFASDNLQYGESISRQTAI